MEERFVGGKQAGRPIMVFGAIFNRIFQALKKEAALRCVKSKEPGKQCG
jgi:hypothetical protein